ncbi:hypothetical protein [Sinimarinibacterium flocculans]|uniref:Uncharacterized protein n=1 Tax=Sinimarinibacterium flocculans TaxID=985250 RepID=A0A318EDA5_9GAMM|nr:hypothetical protein [Sinimarinibacterium flocculans]PXV70493.1 hypothetical protein C8D93_102352 [Sinimarinibacterium flocculans]
MRTLGLLLQIAGWSFFAWSAVVGLSFSAIYLKGFIGTRGNEAGAELLVMLGLTAGALLVGWLVARLGRALRPPPA